MHETEKSRTELLAELANMREKVAHLERLEEQHKAVEKQLRHKEAFNFALFSYNPVFTVVVDREGRVIRSNKAKLKSGDRLPEIGDVMYRDYASRHEADMHGELMGCIREQKTKLFSELKYGRKTLNVTLSPFPDGAIITSQDVTARKQAEEDRTNLIAQLRKALDEVETLRGFLPICAHCKKIRDDQDHWNNIEDYISRHSFADFSHTLCPECVKAFYPEIWARKYAHLEHMHGTLCDHHSPRHQHLPEELEAAPITAPDRP
ncbi:MAG: hypothetical protein GF398_18355 [Chitinivibrionales bacterium]|nr:hypothetical protein [Chitinivibrionales bacterium]